MGKRMITTIILGVMLCSLTSCNQSNIKDNIMIGITSEQGVNTELYIKNMEKSRELQKDKWYAKSENEVITTDGTVVYKLPDFGEQVIKLSGLFTNDYVSMPTVEKLYANFKRLMAKKLEDTQYKWTFKRTYPTLLDEKGNFKYDYEVFKREVESTIEERICALADSLVVDANFMIDGVGYGKYTFASDIDNEIDYYKAYVASWKDKNTHIFPNCYVINDFFGRSWDLQVDRYIIPFIYDGKMAYIELYGDIDNGSRPYIYNCDDLLNLYSTTNTSGTST